MQIKKLPGNNGNAYSASKYLYQKIKINPNRVLDSNIYITEKIDLQFSDNEKGGMIILSTDVNAIQLDEREIVNIIKQKIETIKNRLTVKKKVDTVAQNNNLIGWTIGYFLDGRYTSKKGVPYGENSISVELIGIDSNTLIKVAEELCATFIQEDVLVKDYSTQNIMFVSV